jgi:ABC-type transport system substrate-binding protein
MKYTFERTLSPELVSPGEQFFHNIAGEVEYHNGQANEITGIVAQGDTLTIHLIEPQGDFLTFLAMPFTCAVPIGLPHTEQIAPIPSAGPYYISSWDDPTQRLSISSNPNYHGSRPRRFDSFEYYFNQNADTIKQRVLSGATDWGDGGYWEDLAPDYGPDSPAAQQGLQQWFVVPSNCDGWIPMNTERSLFSDPNMRKAVNYAIDRTVLASMTLPYAASPTDQYLPPGDPGYEDIDAYPMHPDLARARDLAGWHPGDPLRPAVLYYRTSGPDNQQQAQELHDELLQIGIDATMVGWAGGDIYFRMGHRGEPFDLAVSVGWCGSWFDPWDTLFSSTGRRSTTATGT